MALDCDGHKSGSGHGSEATARAEVSSAAIDCAIDCAIDAQPLNVTQLRDSLPPLGHTGGYVSFEGLVRNVNHGKAVVHLEYEAYDRLAVKEMQSIAKTAMERFGLSWVRVVHRVGLLHIGETAVIIQVLARHRREAFAGCHWIIDQIKARVPIWKNETYDDGTSEWTRCHELGPETNHVCARD